MGARLALSIDAATRELERIVADQSGDVVMADGTGTGGGVRVRGNGHGHGNGRYEHWHGSGDGDGDSGGGNVWSRGRGDDEWRSAGAARVDGVVGRGEGRGLGDGRLRGVATGLHRVADAVVAGAGR